MKKDFYITDLIGSYCGMHYYDEAFAELLRQKGCKVEILSNFGEKGEKSFFPLIFHRNKIISICLLFKSFYLLLWHMMTHRRGVYIYMCYGELYDLLMMLPNLWSRRMFSDVHEVHALKYSDKSSISKFFNWYYSCLVRHFIFHSDRTENILTSVGVKVPMLYVPHFKYTFKKNFIPTLLSDDVKDVFNSGRIKYLFFGNLSIVKGIDTVIQAFSNLSENLREKVELVIAGKNVDSMDFSKLKEISENYKVIDRHINDDELVYLYQHTDFVLLPYKKSSQSGIFAMAAYFHKPMIVSDIPYFHKMLVDFPSFGIISPLRTFEETIIKTINSNKDKYYQKEDCERFEMKKETEAFIDRIINAK